MRLLGPPDRPAHCSGCFTQQPDKEHVDLEAAYDGPVLNQRAVIEQGEDAQTIDWLILCENCLEAAGRLIGMERGAADKLKAKDAHIEELTLALAVRDEFIERLKLAVGAKPQGTPSPRQPKSEAVAA